MIVRVGGGAEVLTDASSSASDEDVESIIAEESGFDARRRRSQETLRDRGSEAPQDRHRVGCVVP